MNNHLAQGRRRPAPDVRAFLRDDDGAVTVDWVVLTAAVVLLGVATAFMATSTVPDLANNIDTFLRSQTVVPN